jgi:hypothetical protein
MTPSATLSAISSRIVPFCSSFSSSENNRTHRKRSVTTFEVNAAAAAPPPPPPPPFDHKNDENNAPVESDNRGENESTGRRALILGTSAATFALLNAQPATAKLQGKTGGIPIENFRDLPGTNPPIKYYDIKGGGSDSAVPFPKGTRVAVHYDLKFRSLTIASSRVGAGVTGGNPYGFNVGTPAASPGGPFIPAFNYGIQGMGVGTVRRMLVPAEYAYGNNQVQEIPPNSEVTLDLELLSIAKTGLSK